MCPMASVAGRRWQGGITRTPRSPRQAVARHSCGSTRGTTAFVDHKLRQHLERSQRRVLCKTFRNEFPKDAATAVCVDQAFREREHDRRDAGATALLLPAKNTHTLQEDPFREKKTGSHTSQRRVARRVTQFGASAVKHNARTHGTPRGGHRLTTDGHGLTNLTNFRYPVLALGYWACLCDLRVIQVKSLPNYQWSLH